MTAPYTQQNYAEWKSRFQKESAVGGLLRYAKRAAGIEDEPPPPSLLAPTPPFNPQAPDPTQPAERGLLAPSVAPSTDAEDPTHRHRKGLLGKVRHFFGGDRISQENYDLLEPDQRERLLNMSMLKQIGDGGESEVAANMVTMRDKKKARDMSERQQGLRRRFEAVAATMPPQDGAEYMARMGLVYGFEGAAPMAQATDQMRPKDPMQVSRGAAVRGADGTWSIPSPITPESDPPRVIGGLRGANGKPVTRAVDMQTGRVFWEMPEADSPLAGIGRPPTEAESKDYVFAGLMRNAMPDIRSTSAQVRPEVITALRADPTGALKIVQTDAERVFVRAVLEFTAAGLRKESGAAITGREVSDMMDRYVDTGFDGPPNSPVRKAKARARENYLRLLDNTSARARAYYGDEEDADGGKTMTRAEANALGPSATQELVAKGYRILP